jgi:hypothetical protein
MAADIIPSPRSSRRGLVLTVAIMLCPPPICVLRLRPRLSASRPHSRAHRPARTLGREIQRDDIERASKATCRPPFDFAALSSRRRAGTDRRTTTVRTLTYGERRERIMGGRQRDVQLRRVTPYAGSDRCDQSGVDRASQAFKSGAAPASRPGR